MNKHAWHGIYLLVTATTVSLTGISPASSADGRVEFNRDIRPILADNCFACHGPDSASRKGELRLDQRQAAVDRKAILPNDPAQSELIQRINSLVADEVMPPPSTTA